MADPSPSNPTLCGVRLERAGPVVFLDTNGLVIAPGLMVVTEVVDGDVLAQVVFAPHQLVSNEPRIGSRGVVKRLATAEDIAQMGSGWGASNGLVSAGLPEARAEWLVGPGDEPRLQVAIDDEGSTAGAVIERLFPGRERA